MKKRRRKLLAVGGILGVLAVLGVVLRMLLTSPHAPPPAKPPAPRVLLPPPPPVTPMEPAEPRWPQEPPYSLLARANPVLGPTIWGLFSSNAKAQKGAALELSSHFVASDTLTGLCLEAPDTLWVLSEAIFRRKGMPTVLNLLYKDLHLLSNLEDYEKDDFVDQLPDPMAAYVSLAVSHAPHVHESRRMFAHMLRLIARDAKLHPYTPQRRVAGTPMQERTPRPQAGEGSLTGWIRERDPELRYAPMFLLRLNAYEVLVPYLRDHPGEARAAAPMIFPEKRSDAVDLTADQIQNIFDSLQADPRGRQALVDFLEGCLTQVGMASGPVREKIELFLHLNWDRLPPEVKESAEFIIGRPDAQDQRAASLTAPLPYERWPKTEWKFSLHFADEKDLQEWERFFTAKGYRPEKHERGTIVLSRQIPKGPKISLTGYLYTSLETGMLFGPELRRFQESLARDMSDSGMQGVLIRAHAQFPRTPAFKGVKLGTKLWYDGSCRGAWDLAKLNTLCADCVLIGNVGSGRSGVNNPMIWALLEGMGRSEDWRQLQARVKQAVPEYYTRLIGPWSTPFSRELKSFEESRKPKPSPKAKPKPKPAERKPKPKHKRR